MGMRRYIKSRNKFRTKKVIVNGRKAYIIQKRIMFIFWTKYYHTMENFDLVYKLFESENDAQEYVDYLNN